MNVSLDGRRVLSALDWELGEGENHVLLGPNGCGKTTFLRLIRGELAPDPGGGERCYRIGARVSASPVFARDKIAFVSPEMQERYLSLEWDRTAFDVILTGYRNTDYLYEPVSRKQEMGARQLGERLEISHLIGRNVQTLSQGELRRVLVARALVGTPALLLLDEVCDGLDLRTRGRLLEWIQGIAESGTRIVMATHRREEFIPALTHAVHMGAGQVKRLRRLKARVDAISRPSSKCAPCAKFEDLIHSETRAPREDFLFRLNHAEVYHDKKRALGPLDWEMGKGEHWAVLGHNGAGKSTFLKLLLGEVHPVLGGRVLRFNEARRHTLWEIRQRTGFVSMDFQMRFREELSGADAIATGYFGGHVLYDRLTRKERRRVDELVSLFGLEEFSRRPVTGISYGQLRRVLIARALVHDPEVLVLDEPFDGLEKGVRDALDRQLVAVAAMGVGLVMVTHHPEDLPKCMTHGLLLRHGTVAVQGSLTGGRGSSYFSLSNSSAVQASSRLEVALRTAATFPDETGSCV
ncbi:MAG: ATP-binding cassette domain-containing protein [Verrucomicrobiae bacterium]|nr:ATP-binding cassette domain-containing protein [Verrucomicrobiae bacterium]